MMERWIEFVFQRRFAFFLLLLSRAHEKPLARPLFRTKPFPSLLSRQRRTKRDTSFFFGFELFCLFFFLHPPILPVDLLPPPFFFLHSIPQSHIDRLALSHPRPTPPPRARARDGRREGVARFPRASFPSSLPRTPPGALARRFVIVPPRVSHGLGLRPTYTHLFFLLLPPLLFFVSASFFPAPLSVLSSRFNTEERGEPFFTPRFCRAKNSRFNQRASSEKIDRQKQQTPSHLLLFRRFLPPPPARIAPLSLPPCARARTCARARHR